MPRQLLIPVLLTLALVLPGTAVAQPDLEIVDFTAPPLAVPDDPIGDQILLTIRNAGDMDITTGFSVGFYISPDETITTADQLLLGGREFVDSIGAGEEQFVPLAPSARIPPDYPLGPAYLGVIVDEFNVIPEGNEHNNTAASPVEVVAVLPDLEVVTFTGPALAVPGDPIGDEIYLRIRNASPTDAPITFSVGFYISDDTTIGFDDQLLFGGREFVFGLPGNTEVDVPLSPTAYIPPGYPVGPAYLGVMLDESNVVPESDESDNTASSPVEVVDWTEAEEGPVLSLALHGSFPNPFSAATAIRYDVPADVTRVTLRVFDVRGRAVRTLVDGDVASGERSVTWNGADDQGHRVSPGVYFCRLKASERVLGAKLMLLE